MCVAAVTVAVPVPTAVTVPRPSTVATAGVSLDQVIFLSVVLSGLTTAVSCSVCPGCMFMLALFRVMPAAFTTALCPRTPAYPIFEHILPSVLSAVIR